MSEYPDKNKLQTSKNPNETNQDINENVGLDKNQKLI